MIRSLLIVSVFALSVGVGPAFGKNVACDTPQCRAAKTQLIDLAYESSIAERIAVFRPDLYELIISPTVQVKPGDFMQSLPEGLLLRMQIPRFLLYEKPRGPYGLVYFRDLIPNDLLFVEAAAVNYE